MGQPQPWAPGTSLGMGLLNGQVHGWARLMDGAGADGAGADVGSWIWAGESLEARESGLSVPSMPGQCVVLK